MVVPFEERGGRGEGREEMERLCVYACVCVSWVCVWGPTQCSPVHVIYFRILMSLWSSLLKKHTLLGLWALSRRRTCTKTHACVCMHACTRCIPASTRAHVNIVVSPQLTAKQGSFMHTRRRPPGRLIYFNYPQIHRDPITKIEEYLFFSVHRKRLIKFSCKDVIIWYNKKISSFS